MKKHVPMLALALLMLMVMGFSDIPAQGVVRLHVIANSDNDDDQRIKLLVRDAVLETLRPLENVRQEDKASAMVLASGEALQARVEQVLKREGKEYGAELYFGDYPFPQKTYGQITYPAGDYTALRIVLGVGEGHNWWCVLFPPLCLSELPDKNAAKRPKTEKDKVKFRSVFADWFSK